MKKDLSKLERLDLAARAMVSEMALHRIRIGMSFLSVVLGLLALSSTASPAETLSIRGAAAVCVVLTLLAWFGWRYSFHAFALACVGLAILTFLFDSPHPHTVLGWISQFALAFVWSNVGYHLLKRGILFAAIRGQGWETERSQVQDWFEGPMNQERSSVVLDIPTGSFWTGYFTYRLVHLGDSWAVMKFKTGNYYRLLDFRILDKSMVRVKEVVERRLEIELDNVKVRNVSPTPEVHDSLIRLVAAVH